MYTIYYIIRIDIFWLYVLYCRYFLSFEQWPHVWGQKVSVKKNQRAKLKMLADVFIGSCFADAVFTGDEFFQI